MRSVDDIADELYALAPAAFTAARDEAAAQARQGGDAEAAKRLAGLKRPTQGAHLVNLLALRRPEVVADLLALGEQLRAAQGGAGGSGGARGADAAQLRELSSRRRSALAAAVQACRALALDAGEGEPSAAQLAEAQETLGAAMADDQAAELVRAGRVVKALTYAGFGSGFGATAPKSSARTSVRRPEPQPQTAADERRREAERAARERLARAEAELADARARESAANEELDRIADELTRLRSALDDATGRARAAKAARQAAERTVNLARRELSTSGA